MGLSSIKKTLKDYEKNQAIAFLRSYCSYVQPCATLITGNKQQVTVQSEPLGAEVYVKNQLVGKTPLVVEMKRNTKQITLKKEDCYDYVHTCNIHTNGKYWLNLAFLPFGGIPAAVFLCVDLASGAAYKQEGAIYVKMNAKPKQ